MLRCKRLLQAWNSGGKLKQQLEIGGGGGVFPEDSGDLEPPSSGYLPVWGPFSLSYFPPLCGFVLGPPQEVRAGFVASQAEPPRPWNVSGPPQLSWK